MIYSICKNRMQNSSWQVTEPAWYLTVLPTSTCICLHFRHDPAVILLIFDLWCRIDVNSNCCFFFVVLQSKFYPSFYKSGFLIWSLKSILCMILCIYTQSVKLINFFLSLHIFFEKQSICFFLSVYKSSLLFFIQANLTNFKSIKHLHVHTINRCFKLQGLV